MTLSDVTLDSGLETADFPYRALSRGAVAACILALVALVGLIPGFSALLAVAVVGLALAIAATISTTRYPDEISGRPLAIAALALNLLILLGGVAEHTYIYLTEVPDGYERVGFHELERPENEPDFPTERAAALNGQDIFLKGYIHPSSGSGQLRQFILVPDLGTCCFGGQPRSTSMIEVTLSGANTVRHSMRKLKLAGKFQIDPRAGVSQGFDSPIFYKLRAEHLD